MPVNLRGARVLVTGATGGIGGAIVRAFHERGAELVLTGRRTDILDDLIADVGGKAIAADLADPDSVAQLTPNCCEGAFVRCFGIRQLGGLA